MTTRQRKGKETPLREALKKQHQEVCQDFDDLGVCPRGMTCHRAHIYERVNSNKIALMLDYLIGQVTLISADVKMNREHISSISEKLNIDTQGAQERGTSATRESRRRSRKQIGYRSMSQDRGFLSRTPSLGDLRRISPASRQTPPPALSAHAQPYNPPQQVLFSPGQVLSYPGPYIPSPIQHYTHYQPPD